MADDYLEQLAAEIDMENTYRSRIEQPSVCVYCRHSLVECHDETGCHWRQEGAVRGCGCKLPVAQGVARLEQAATSGDGSESAGLRERLLAKCDELDSRAKAFADNNQYYFRGVGEGFATAAKEFRALAALAPAISRCDVYTELCKPQTDIKFRLECVRELGHKEPHAYEFPPAISRPPTQGSALPPSRADLGGDRIRESE